MHHSIHEYYAQVQRIRNFGGTNNEISIRTAFFELLNKYARQKGLEMVAEVSIKTENGNSIIPDGTLKDSLRQNWGYWESKKEANNLDEEIEKKFAKGYPKENILFEDGNHAVLFQKGERICCPISATESLHDLLTLFFSFERPEVKDFRTAIELFKQDVPKVTETLREIIMNAEQRNESYKQKSEELLNLCRESINPFVSRADIREMIIQHILTEDIFNTIFDETQFHRENNIAIELDEVVKTFFTGNFRRATLQSIKHYYDAIKAAAARIADHHEKQKFLKIIYETFYKSYNPKAADRLGVVYTPNEIVRFMIESTDYLLQKHFHKYLEDKSVEILDPATGTGTYICDLIDYIRIEKLKHKYEHEIHANEVAILPYYISNLNIEFTYAQKMGEYAEFKNLCFVDTLDNTGGLKAISERSHEKYGAQSVMFTLTQTNTERIKAQNKKKISVIIGNPPYNANQANENDNNKNREYPLIDLRIKDTFIKHSTAQKTKLYDMYSRFYRWAFDRLDSNGIVAFVTNRSFIDSRTFDGFRKIIQDEFDTAYIIDTLSDVRTNPKIAGTTHNVFGIQTGVAIMFLIKKEDRENDRCKIHYIAMDDFWKKEDKLKWLSDNPLKKIQKSFEIIRPDKNNNWINLAENDFESLVPLCSKDVKFGLDKKDEESKIHDDVKIEYSREAIFGLYSTGISTNRDEWIVDISKDNLENKMQYFANYYNSLVGCDGVDFTSGIKWSRNLKQRFARELKEVFDCNKIKPFNYRPFSPKSIYHSELFIDEHGFTNRIFHDNNVAFCISGNGSSKPFQALGVNTFLSLDFLEKTQCLPLYRYDESGNRIDNITDWGLEQFRARYFSSSPALLHSGEGGFLSSNLNNDGDRVAQLPSPNWRRAGDEVRTVEVNLPPQLLAHARELRKNQTDAEELLWQLLRGRKLNGLKFRRQHPLRVGFILDFYCAETKLCVEIDGGYHSQPEQQEYDAERTKIINEYGISVIRFTNEEVLNNTAEVLRKILTPNPLLHFGEGTGMRKKDIFHYVYAVLHNPAYRKKYELNLKREFPRIPFYEDFYKWAKWGERLMELHLNYEKVEPYQLRITNYELRNIREQNVGAEFVCPKTKLKADKEAGVIVLDEQTELHDIPAVAWEYKLGNRSALEWILDQYQEKKPKDPTIAEKFNTYRFADYKEQVIDLLKRVCTVSVETMKIIEEMEQEV